MAVQPYAELGQSQSNRKVWVENIWDQDYTEDFRGDVITVPAKGRILMPFLRANRFLSEVRGTYEILPNGQYKGVPKALRLVELTDEERAEIENKTVAEVKSEKDKIAKMWTCAECGDMVATEQGLKAHITRKHPAKAEG